MAAYNIYSDEMLSLTYGSPLWEPDSRPEEVSIGDVGYIRNGRFCRLFNATYPEGDSRNMFGLPSRYEPLPLDERAMVHRRLPPGVMMSRSIVKYGADVEFNGSILDAGGVGFEFSCKKDRGAVLIINSEARRKDSEQRGAFKKYMLQHCKSWLAFANGDPLSRDITLSDLVFVTGRDNTADWAVAAFADSKTSAGVSFDAGFPHLAGASLSLWGSWKGIRGTYANCGPGISIADPTRPVCAAQINEYNQCVFLRGFRVMDRRSHVLKAIKLKVPDKSGGLDVLSRPWVSRSQTSLSSSTSSLASPSSVHTRQSTLAMSPTTNGNALGLEIVSNEPTVFSHAQYVLVYMLENSSADMAIVHDEELAVIASSPTVEEDSDFCQLLLHSLPGVVVEDHGGVMIATLALHEKLQVPQQEEPNLQSTRRSTPLPPSERSTPRPGTTPRLFETELPPSHFDPQMTPNSRPKNISPEFVDSSVRPHRRVSQSQRKASGRKTTKFDTSAYEQEQNQMKDEINMIQVKLTEVRDKISLVANGGDRVTLLRSEIDRLRNEQIGERARRTHIIDDIKRHQDGIQKRGKELHTRGKKLPAKTVAALEAQIQALDQQVESGRLGIGDERKAVNTMSTLRRARTAVREYESLAASLREDRARVAELQKGLDERLPDISEKLAQARGQLDTLYKQRAELNSQRDQLYQERDDWVQKLSDLKGQLRQSMRRMKEDQDAYYQKLSEERAKEAEQQRINRQVEDQKRREAARRRLLDRASIPMFSAEKRDCQTLLDYFGSKSKSYNLPITSSPTSTDSLSPLSSRSESNHPGAEWVPLARKNEKEEVFFLGGKGKNKAKKSRALTAPQADSASRKFSIPFDIMTTLSKLQITPPSTTGDVSRTIDELDTKMKWLEDNETKATEENVAQMRAFLERTSNVSVSTQVL